HRQQDSWMWMKASTHVERHNSDPQSFAKDVFVKIVRRWQRVVKHPEQGAAEGAPFIAEHLIRQTERAFDDFAGGQSDPAALREMMGF
ncbi:MAG: hypothetical protein VX228_07435, partial [Pseudomonadota bacterium]|nr:hypothetical protein [Pseudomonadota bacterium]